MQLSPDQFPGASPVAAISAARDQYSRGMGLPIAGPANRIVQPASATQAMAAEYAKMPEFQNSALPSYHAMAEETGRQFDHMTAPRSKGGMGIDVSVHDEDQYPGDNPFGGLKNDVTQNSHIGVLSTAATGGHPVFSNDTNDMFRAVHDVFGHLGSGRGVDRHGEEAAYQSHAAMYSPQARGALASETRGQNSSLIQNGSFPVQKAALMPSQYSQAGLLHPQQFDNMAELAQQAKGFNQQQGIG